MVSGKIALTGGIATGKSTVARLFAECGAEILDADQVAREVVKPGAAGWEALRSLLGPDYFEAIGELNRRRLRERIIADPQCRARVNAALHPAIMAAMDARWRELRETEPSRPVIFDIPLLFEAGMDEGFDLIILAYTPRSIQLERLMARDRLTFEEAECTLAMQLPIESKRSRSRIIIENGEDLEHTRLQVLAVWNRLTKGEL